MVGDAIKRKHHVKPERNYSFRGYFRCETGENIGGFFSDKTRAVSEKEALNNIKFLIAKKHNLLYGGRPMHIELYDYKLEIIVTPVAPPPPTEKNPAPKSKKGAAKKDGPKLPFD